MAVTARLAEINRLSLVDLTGRIWRLAVSSIRPASVSVSVVAWVSAVGETPYPPTGNLPSPQDGMAEFCLAE